MESSSAWVFAVIIQIFVRGELVQWFEISQWEDNMRYSQIDDTNSVIRWLHTGFSWPDLASFFLIGLHTVNICFRWYQFGLGFVDNSLEGYIVGLRCGYGEEIFLFGPGYMVKYEVHYRWLVIWRDIWSSWSFESLDMLLYWYTSTHPQIYIHKVRGQLTCSLVKNSTWVFITVSD